MNNSGRVCNERVSSQWRKEEGVKGGLTPIALTEVAPGEVTDNGRLTRRDGNQGSGSASSSRPLMTLPSPKIKVPLPKWEVTPGLLGIYNHGNTCFMNTILQCLSNSDLVAEYFVLKKFKEVLNVKGIAKRLVSSPKGEVTEHLGILLESIWSGEYTPEISNQFKNVVSKYNSQYRGSSQHDAQEFLLWLLDRTNDELSTKKKNKDTLSKIKSKDKNDIPPDNTSEIPLGPSGGYEVYSKFQASYQSSLICPNCGEQSNTYESYLCLSLPVPQKSSRPVYMTVVYLDDNPKQLKIALEMNVFDTVKELREKLAYELEVPPKRLILCQVHEDGFGNTYGDEQLLSDIHESENVYVFETHPLSEVNQSPSAFELIQILLVHVEKCAASKSMVKFCSPEVMRIPRDVDFKSLQKCILKSMQFAVSETVVETKFDRAIFDIRVIDSGASDCYLPTDVEMPLYTQAIDRALSTYCEEFGPAHVKFVIEWDPEMKQRLVDNDDDNLEEHQSVHKVRLSQQQPTTVSLKDCLKLFTKEEKLDASEAWNCPHCPSHSNGTVKKLGLLSAPDILVIHLKRFRHTGMRRNKLNILVNFPINDLEMGEHLLLQSDSHQSNQPTSDLYDLYGVSNHYGDMNGGHYTAFCRNPIDMNWYEYDDTKVNPLPVREIVSKSAYLLFYQRRKLTNTTISRLQENTHWIYSIYGPPIQSSMPVNSFLDRNPTDVSVHPSVIHIRAKSEPYTKKDAEVDVISSPRRDKCQIDNTLSRQMVNETIIEKSLAGLDRQYAKEPGQRFNDRPKLSVAEQILRSKSSTDQTDSRVAMITNLVSVHEGYGRSDTVESYKHTYTSSSDGSQGSSTPPSPLSDNPDLMANGNSGKTIEKTYHANVLNNAREFTNQSSQGVGSKLKIHSNQIYTQDPDKDKNYKTESTQPSYVSSKYNTQKLTNLNAQYPFDEAIQPSHVELFSTPQQTRRSPTHTNGVFSTPQPHRKQYNESRHPIDRQSSVPTRNRPQSSYDEPSLRLDDNLLLNDQPRSLPSTTASYLSKPPLPKHPSHSHKSALPHQRSLDGKQSLPSALHPSRSVRVPDTRTVVDTDSRHANGTGHQLSNYENERSHDMAIHRVPAQVRPRNRSADRNFGERRSMRTRTERPQSYHHSMHHNDFQDQYYLSQPTDTGNFDRSTHYATMRPTHGNRDHGEVRYMEEDMQYMARQLADQEYSADLNSIHQPRSRNPLTYNPSRYKDGTERYQPHMHMAKHLSHMARQEKLYLQQKMRSQYLKESSV